MTNKTTLHIFSLLLTFQVAGTLSVDAQFDKREVGLTISNFQNFGAVLKKQVADNKYDRLSASNLQFNAFGANRAMAIGLGAGREKRKAVGAKTKFIHGPSALFNIAMSNSEQGLSSANLQAGAGYILGLMYDLNEDFYIGLETIPSITANISKISGQDIQIGSQIGFNQSAVTLSIVHRFARNKSN